MTVPEIIKQLGGAAALAAGIGLPSGGVGPLRVRAWSQRGCIPGCYWSDIATFASSIDQPVTLEVLAAAHPAPDRAAA